MNKQYLENVISKEKIFYNLKKYAWIFIVCIVLALGVSIALLASKQVTEDEVTEEETTEEEPVTRIMARSALVELKWDSPVTTDLDYTMRLEEIEKIRCIVTTTDFMNVVNDNLIEADMDVYKEVDYIVVDKIALDMCQIYVVSQCQDERLINILDTAIEYVFNKAIEETSLVSYEVKERGDLSYPCIVDGRYYFYPVIEEEIEEEVNISEDAGFDKESLLSVIVVVLLAIFGGILILLLIITLDKKIYTKNEVARVLELECLADYTDLKLGNEKVKNIIGGKCKLQGVSKLCFTGCNKLENNQKLDQVVEYLGTIGIISKVVDDVISNDERLLEIVDSTIVLVVQSKVDTIDTVWEVYNSVRQMGKEVDGFIIQ